MVAAPKMKRRGFRNFSSELVKDSDSGNYSSKRFIALFSFLVLVVAFIVNTFFGLPISEFLIDNFMYIIIAGMGITTGEKIGERMLGRDSRQRTVIEQTTVTPIDPPANSSMT